MTDAHEPPDADEALLGRLRAAALVGDGIPGHVIEAARAAFSLRDLDAQLATLVSDSAERAAGDSLVLMRGADEPRALTFEAGAVTVDVEVTSTDGALRMVGLVAGGEPGELTVEYDDGSSLRTDLDRFGRFVTDVRRGRARLRLSFGGSPVVTPWTTF
ncbi:MAG: hypothetical protein ACJ74O_20380 [Frankiaceae bacterium]